MHTYSFGLVVSDFDFADDDVVNALYDAGVEDASFAVRDGSSIAYFDKDAESYPVAVAEAIREIEGALPGARVVGIHVEDLLTPSGVASVSSKSRQNVHQHIKGLRGSGFPAPVTWADEDRPLWLLGDVQHWSRGAAETRPNAGMYWPSVASAVFHLARASCLRREETFEPAIDMLLERFLTLSAAGGQERRQLAKHLRTLADELEAEADVVPAQPARAAVQWLSGE